MEDSGAVAALEHLIIGGVGITTRALVEAHPEADLTLQQWRALVIVASREGLRVGEIAQRVGGSLPTTSRLIRRLERRGLVITERDETDRRATIVLATAEGRRVWLDIATRRRELIAVALQTLDGHLPPEVEATINAIAGSFDRYA